ncbi:MAG: polymer-forming cytoskeletal protein, partial [Hyphomicrobiaceae bacterium]
MIGTDLSITGNLESKGEIQIEGEVQGDIHAGRIVVGERARVTGSLLADDIVIRGNVGGSVRGNTVTLQSNSRVEGDLFHRSLSIEQ